MDPSLPLVLVIVGVAAVWTIWTRLVPPVIRRRFAGYLQRTALEPRRNRWSRDFRLWLAQHVVGRCCSE